MKARDGKEVIRFIKHNTSIQAFYDFITHHGTNFSFNINDCHADDFKTPLIKALYVKNMPLVHALLEMGADPNQSYTYYERTPLHDAILTQNLEAIRDLVDHGACLDVPVDTLGDNSLTFAIKQENKEIVDYIYRHIPTTTKPRINRAHPKEYHHLVTQLQEAILNKNSIEVEKILSLHCLNLNRIYYDMICRFTRLATWHKDLETVKVLAKHHDDLIEAEHSSRLSIPAMACKIGRPDISAFLQEEQQKRYAILKLEADKQNEANNKPQQTLGQPGLFQQSASVLPKDYEQKKILSQELHATI